MSRKNTSLPILSLRCSIPCREPVSDTGFVSETDPAYCVMTDFQFTAPVTIVHTSSIDNALQTMKDRGVRLLLVTETDKHRQWQIIRGLFSTTHISKMVGRDIHQPLHAAHIFSELQQARG